MNKNYHYFFDSSALIMRYLKKKGSDRVLEIYKNYKNIIHISQITTTKIVDELTNYLENDYKDEYLRAERQFRFDKNRRFSVFKTSDSIIIEALKLRKEHTAIDEYGAIELATALFAKSQIVKSQEKLEKEQHENETKGMNKAESKEILKEKIECCKSINFIFVSADEELNKAAEKKCLIVKNPNDYNG